jgi:hypothetical protein
VELDESGLLNWIVGTDQVVLFSRVHVVGGLRKEIVGAFISSIDIDIDVFLLNLCYDVIKIYFLKKIVVFKLFIYMCFYHFLKKI